MFLKVSSSSSMFFFFFFKSLSCCIICLVVFIWVGYLGFSPVYNNLGFSMWEPAVMLTSLVINFNLGVSSDDGIWLSRNANRIK